MEGVAVLWEGVECRAHCSSLQPSAPGGCTALPLVSLSATDLGQALQTLQTSVYTRKYQLCHLPPSPRKKGLLSTCLGDSCVTRGGLCCHAGGRVGLCSRAQLHRPYLLPRSPPTHIF